MIARVDTIMLLRTGHYHTIVPLQLCKYHVTQMRVHGIKFDARTVMKIYRICHIVTDILTLIGNLACLKGANTMEIILDRS